MARSRGRSNQGNQRSQGNRGNQQNNILHPGIINYAVQSGVKSLARVNPNFENFKPYIVEHLDQDKITGLFYELNEEAEKHGLSEKGKINFVYQNLADYIASGNALDFEGHKILLEKNLEGKTNLLYRLLHPYSGGAKRLNNTLKVFNDMYTLLMSNKGEYAKIMPELTEKAVYMKRMNFLAPALDLMSHYGWIDKREEDRLYKEAIKKSTESIVGFKQDIKNYIIPQEKEKVLESYQKISAGLFLIFGLSLLFLTGVNLTGNVIGNVSPRTSGLISGVLIFISLLMFFIFRRRSK
jgi:hypothetical protein